jgi:hypothetical protein
MPGRGDFPGLQRRHRKNGSLVLYWVALPVAVAAGYTPKTVHLHNFVDESPELSERCQKLQAEMEVWLANRDRVEKPVRFDGTVRGVIRQYKTHPLSPYQEFPDNSRRTADKELRAIDRAVGERRLEYLQGIDFRRWYKEFRKPSEEGGAERITSAHHRMTRVRAVFSFGGELGLPHAKRLREELSRIRFEMPKSRTQQVTFEQTCAFIVKAHELGYYEMAMAQALQFEFMLRQTDVIGKWEPSEKDPHVSEWVTGVRWEEITQNGVLSHTTGKRRRNVALDVKVYPLVQAELDRLAVVPSFGPIVVDSKTGNPFKYENYRKRWRQIARAAGIPDDVWNRDSRAGGVTEAGDAGAEKEDMRQHAGHAQARTTEIYNRASAVQTSRVEGLRVAHRARKNKS